MSTEVPDLRGDYVTVGDTIAYAAQDGDTSGLRIGKVIEVVPPKPKTKWSYREPSTKLRIEVDYSTGYSKPSKPVLIDASLKRFVKVND